MNIHRWIMYYLAVVWFAVAVYQKATRQDWHYQMSVALLFAILYAGTPKEQS